LPQDVVNFTFVTMFTRKLDKKPRWGGGHPGSGWMAKFTIRYMPTKLIIIEVSQNQSLLTILTAKNIYINFASNGKDGIWKIILKVVWFVAIIFATVFKSGG